MNDVLRLGVFHNQSNVSIFDIVDAARGVCRIVWIVGWAPDASPTRSLARFGEVCDVSGMDEVEVIEYLESVGLDGVVIFNDPPLVLAARVAEALGLRFHSPGTAALLADKFAQRTALAQAGVVVPAFAAVSSSAYDTDVPFPAVLKPRLGAGGRDTFFVKSRSELVAALAKCDPSEGFILEQWLADRDIPDRLGADLVSAESVARDGEFSHVMVTGRFPFAPPFRETGSFLPSDITLDERESVCELAERAMKAVGIRDGVIHTEIKLTPDGPRVIEINGRLGGGVPQLIESIGGPSLMNWAMRLALGEDVGPFPALGDSLIAFFYVLVGPETAVRVDDVAGLTELDAMRGQLGIDNVRLNLRPGDQVNSQQSSFLNHVVRIDGVARSRDDLAQILRKINETLCVTWSYE